MICNSCGSEIPDGLDSCFVCGETFKKMNYAYNPVSDPVQDVPTTSSKKSGSSAIVIAICAVLVLLGLGMLFRSGAFSDKSGRYYSQDIDRALDEMAKGQPAASQNEMKKVKIEYYLDINHSDCDLVIRMEYKDQVLLDQKYTGKIHFYGNRANVTFGVKDKTVATYNKDEQSLTFSFDDPELDEFGLGTMTFVRKD